MYKGKYSKKAQNTTVHWEYLKVCVSWAFLKSLYAVCSIFFVTKIAIDQKLVKLVTLNKNSAQLLWKVKQILPANLKIMPDLYLLFKLIDLLIIYMFEIQHKLGTAFTLKLILFLFQN